MTVRETYRYHLLNWPTLYSCPLDVSIHIFAVCGNGYDWDENGNLTCDYDKESNTPKFDNNAGMSSIPAHSIKYQLQYEAKLLKWKFMQDNIERVLDTPVDSTFFKSDIVNRAYITSNITLDYATCLHFPDNIQKDWIEAVATFLDWWIYQLRSARGVDTSKSGDEMMHFWTTQQKKEYDTIHKAMERLYEVRTGISYEEGMGRLTELANEIINEIKEKNAKT